MSESLFKKAKEFQKSHKWQTAIQYYEKYIDKSKEICDDNTYVSLAKCYRMVGSVDRSEAILNKGKDIHPKSERILLEFHNLYDYKGDWITAKEIAYGLINLNPKKANHYFRLGRTYAYLKNYDMAEKNYKTGLELRHSMPINKLIKVIQQGISEEYSNIITQYICIEGKNNLGAFTHEYKGRRYFTKVSRFTRGSRRELAFYKDICNEATELKKIVPQYIDSKIIDRILYLTIELIDGTPAKLGDINKVIDASSLISDVKYNSIIKKHPNPKYTFQLKNRPVSAVLYFTEIDRKEHNENLFFALRKLARQNNYPVKLNYIIDDLEALILENYLYAFLDRDKHFSLLHGDFIPQNTRLTKDNEQIYVFDWAIFTVGPYFIDIARYLSTTFVPYSQIRDMQLFKKSTVNQSKLIDEIFFLYSLIVLYILTHRKRIKPERKINDFILPALNDMKNLVEKFKSEKHHKLYKDRLLNLLTENERLIDENRQLKKRIKRLRTKNTSLSKKMRDVLNSKSWKITYPLRKIMQKIKRDNKNS